MAFRIVVTLGITISAVASVLGVTCPGVPGHCSETHPGQTCVVVCDRGRPNVPLCQADGTWTDIPRCVEHDPGVEQQIAGVCPGIPGYCSQGFFGSDCKFACASGPPIDSVCTIDGTWEPYPRCDGDIRETQDGCNPCPGPNGRPRFRPLEEFLSKNFGIEQPKPAKPGRPTPKQNVVPSFAGASPAFANPVQPAAVPQRPQPAAPRQQAFQPAAAAQPQAQPQFNAQPQPRPQFQPQAQPQFNPQPQAQPQFNAQPQPRPQFQPQAQPQFNPQPQAQPQFNSQPQFQPQFQPQGQPQFQPQGQPQLNTQPQPAGQQPQRNQFANNPLLRGIQSNNRPVNPGPPFVPNPSQPRAISSGSSFVVGADGRLRTANPRAQQPAVPRNPQPAVAPIPQPAAPRSPQPVDSGRPVNIFVPEPTPAESAQSDFFGPFENVALPQASGVQPRRALTQQTGQNEQFGPFDVVNLRG